jgi:hypothetical protein
MLRVNDTFEFSGLGVSDRVGNAFSKVKEALLTLRKPDSTPSGPLMPATLAPTSTTIDWVPITVGVLGVGILAWALFLRK